MAIILYLGNIGSYFRKDSICSIADLEASIQEILHEHNDKENPQFNPTEA